MIGRWLDSLSFLCWLLLVVILLAILVFLMETTVANGDSYLPIVAHRHRAEKGLAYANWELMPDARERLGLDPCAPAYQWSPYYDDCGRIPHLSRVEQLAMFQRDYVALKGCGGDYLIVGNEPDLSGQQNLTPKQAAGFVLGAMEMCPDMDIVAPNYSHVAPIDEQLAFIREYRQRGGDFDRWRGWGLHWYGDTPQKATAYINAVLTMLDSEGLGSLPLYFTEYGTCNDSNAKAIFEAGLFHPRVDALFGYAPFSTVGECGVFFDENKNITDVGIGFMNAGN